jgi:hypothetical protein
MTFCGKLQHIVIITVKMNPGVPPLSILRVMFPTMLDYDLAQLTASEVRLRMRQYVNAQKC